MKKFIKLVAVICIFFHPNFAMAQFDTFRDPGLAYNKIVLDQSDGSKYDIVSNYKVIGTPYLFGQNKGSIFTADNQVANNTPLRYNSFTQKIEIGIEGNTKFITKKLEEIDSFYLSATDNTLFKNDLHFIRGTLMDKSKLNFMQIICVGKNANLYKAYFSDLGIVSSNYVQSELRQYELKFNYYYSSPNTNGLKKIKLNTSWLNKEFALYDIGSITKSGLSSNSEATLKEAFKKINQ